MSAVQSQNGWRMAGFSAAVLLLLTITIYHQTILYLIGLWSEMEMGEYGHGYLILAISGFLVLRKRRLLSALATCPHPPALLAVLAASLIWTVGALVDVLMLQTVGLLLLVVAIAWTVFGNRVTEKLLLPLLFIGFAIPVWFPLAPVLQELSADVVFRLIRVLGIPAFRQANEIVLPAGTLSVTEACSGLRYLVPGIALGLLYGYLNYATLRARLMVVLISATAAVLVNIVRVFVVVYLGYTTEMQHPFVGDHLVLGWYLFAGMVVILLVIDALLHRHYTPSESDRTGDDNRYPLPFSCGKGGFQRVATLVAAAVLLSVGPAAAYWVDHHPAAENVKTELELPAGTGGWTGPFDSADDWQPVYYGAINRKQAYQKAGEQVDVYIGYYTVQTQGQELINDLNWIGDPKEWHSRNPKGNLRQVDDRRVLEQVLEGRNGVKQLVWYWYRVAGRLTVSPYQAKALQVWGLLTGNAEAVVTAISIKIGTDVADARHVLGEFLTAMDIPYDENHGATTP